VDLRGFDPTAAAEPAAILRELLHLLNGAADRLPTGLPALRDAYRSRLAGRRVLVILDNAGTAEQVRPLLPPAPALAVVTSRCRLGGLTAAVELTVLSAEESRQALARRIGSERAEAEPGAVDQIVARCGGLPLALAIVAARAALHPDFPLAELAAELDTWGPLDAFASAGPATDVRAVFSWSYRQLPRSTQALFRLLALHPGPELGTAAVAALAGLPVPRARPLLAQLAGAHLLTERAPGRFVLHDMLAAYAEELGSAVDPEEERAAARRRLLDHYLHTAVRAATLFDPLRETVSMAGLPSAGPAEPLADRAEAVAWLRAERVPILRLVERAAAAGLDAHAVRLAWAVAQFLVTAAYRQDLVAVQRVALSAAVRMGDGAWEAHIRRDLGNGCAALGRYDEAHTHLRRADALFRELGDHRGQARARNALGQVMAGQERLAEAAEQCRRAQELYRRAGDPRGEANSLNAVGYYEAQLGNHPEALAHCRSALRRLRAMGDALGAACALDSVGYAYHRLGRHREAVASFDQAIRELHELGYRSSEANALLNLARAHESAGNHIPARGARRQARLILDELDRANGTAR
jgi:tetratricopeptide (TPR) repeat protein